MPRVHAFGDDALGDLDAVGLAEALKAGRVGVVHVIRNAMRFAPYKDRKKVASSIRAIYTAPTEEAGVDRA